MDKSTEIILKEWARRVNIAAMRIIPVSSNRSPARRIETATSNAIKSFNRKQEDLDSLRSYLTYVDKILEKEEG